MILDNGLLNVIMIYAPNSEKPEEEKESSCNKLLHLVSCIHQNEMVVLAGDLNGHVGSTNVSRYQKKYSPTHTYRGHQSSLICFIHLLWSMASSLTVFFHNLSKFSLVYLLAWDPPPHFICKMTAKCHIWGVESQWGLWPWNSISGEIFVHCTYPPSFIILRLIVRKLSCWQQTNKPTNRCSWKHLPHFPMLPGG